MNLKRALGALVTAGLLGLVACSSDRPKPTQLETYEPKMRAARVWTLSLGGLGFPMQPAQRDGQLYVANGSGDVMAVQGDTGDVLWRASTGGKLSAGVGSDGRFTAVVTRGNEVVVFEKGAELWRKRVPSAVVTAPLVAGERVFVLGVDRGVHAFDALDGRRLWVYSKPGDALTLAHPSVVAAFKNSLLVAQGQRLTALDPLRGTVSWETSLASPRGTNEVERLADLIGPAVRVGDRVCARAFQSAVACADAARGSVLWTRTVGGINGVGGDAERVYGADASDRITAWRAENGDTVWQSEKLLYRGLSGALAVGPNVVFGDVEGYVHFLAAASGEQQLRLPTDGNPVIGTPLLVGKTLVVTTQGGALHAFRSE